MKARTLAAIALAAALSGCMGAGTHFEFDQARQVRVGMTAAELTALMGQPFRVTSQGGREIWVWSYTSPGFATRSVSFILEDGAVVEVPSIPQGFGR